MKLFYRYIPVVLFTIVLSVFDCTPGKSDAGIYIDNTFQLKPGATFKRLMRIYSKRHYGVDTFQLKNPRMIVVHCTYGSENIKNNISFFSSPSLRFRTKIKRGGMVNVSVHFLIDRNGNIYSLLPLSCMGRHAIGFNYTAIGIENIGRDNSRLTDAQLRSNRFLITYLTTSYSSITYLVGHHEYNEKHRAHYHLLRCLDKTYLPYNKQDPGKKFMERLRSELLKDGITLLD